MMQGLLSSNAAVWIETKHFFHQIVTLSWNSWPNGSAHLVNSFLHISKNIFISVTVKWRLSTEKNVKNYTAWPYVALFCVLTSQYFWCYIVWCTVSLVHFRIRVKGLGCTKINDFNHGCILVWVKQEILGFKVSVDNLHWMTVRYCRQNLLQNQGSISLTVVRSLDNLLK